MQQIHVRVLLAWVLCLSSLLGRSVSAESSAELESIRRSTLKPYDGVSVPGVDTRTLTGKVMCGYQGWFGAEGDDLGRGWYHWQRRGEFAPGQCSIDLWPDMTELDSDERYPTAFRHADGRVAEVYSAFNAKTVRRHFRWMRDYGIDGVFVQRFITEASHPKGLRHFNVVLDHCRAGANQYGRAYALMYDLSGLDSNRIDRVIEDWKTLVDQMHITRDPAYLHHKGKPVVAVWGLGFNDGRKYTLREGMKLVRFLKEDTTHGNCTVMLGVPTHWRSLERDALDDPALHELVRMADIVSPWTVGRFRAPDAAQKYARQTLAGDLQWCATNGLECMPVVFPGFSWHNMKPESPLDLIPRLGGRFLWSQFVACKNAGAAMIYQAMFDEVDEGTAIFKCENDPPVGASRFLTYEGLPSDFYLTLVGRAARMMRGEIPPTETPPSQP